MPSPGVLLNSHTSHSGVESLSTFAIINCPMSNDTKNNQIKSRLPLQLTLAFITYVVGNMLCIYAPFIPTPAVMIFWGLLAPLLGFILYGRLLYNNRERLPKWKILWTSYTLGFIALGIFTISTVAAIWASI